MKALLVDDDLFTGDLLEAFLKKNEFETARAYSLAEGEKLFAVEGADIVFLDILLPDGNGIDLLKQIRATNKSLPVVMVTGFKDAERVVTAFREGATDCLLKPFNLDYLKSEILPKVKSGGQGGS